MPAADPDHHWAQSGTVDKSIVLGFKSRYLRAEIPNRYVAEYVSRYPQKLIGFAGIDPTERGAVEEVRIAKNDLQLRGITLSPANQDFHPTDSRAMRVYAEAEQLGHADPDPSQRPVHRTEQARIRPALPARRSRPHVPEAAARDRPARPAVGRRDDRPARQAPATSSPTSAGCSAGPWQAYNALVTAYQYGVIDKLLFGSDFPYTNATECIEALYSINQIAQGTNLPVVPREALRGIVERDTLNLLGLG